MTIENLDADQTIVNSEGKITPYFEDAWFQLIQAIGGEGNNNSQVALDLALYPPDLAQVNAKLNALLSRFAALEAVVNDTPLGPDITRIKNELGDIEKQLNPPINLTAILHRLAAIEAQL